MQPLPHKYNVAAHGVVSGNLTLHAADVPSLTSAAPAEFDGPGDQWSPESLLVGAVAGCFILTFRAVARAAQLEWTSLECNVDGTLDRLDGVTQFKHLVTRATLTIPLHTTTVSAERALAKAEESCLIANSLRCRRELQMEIVRLPVEHRTTELVAAS